MSDHPQSATPTLPSAIPWLPEAAPRVLAPPPPRPVDPYARALLNGFNPPTHVKHKRRFPWVPIVMVILLVAAAGTAYKFVLNATKREAFVVQTEAFTFVLPDTPQIEPVIEVGLTGTQWIVPPGLLAAISFDFGIIIEESEQPFAFDTVITGGASAVNGTVTSETSTMTNGVYRRDVIIAAPEGILHMVGFGKGQWMVLFGWGPVSDSEFPAELADVIASFSFY